MAKQELKSGVLGLAGDTNKKVNAFIPDKGMYKLQGFTLDEAMSLTKSKGLQKFNTVQLAESGNPATFTGIFDYVKSDGTIKHVATTTKHIYYMPNSTSWSAVDVTDTKTGDSTKLFDAATFNDLFFIGQGIDPNKIYDGTNLRNMGIAAPPAESIGCDLAGAGAGNLSNGTYTYRVTFQNGTFGHESNPSGISPSVAVVDKTTNGKVLLNPIPVSSDPQVTARRIYRTTVGGGGVWLLVATVNNNTATTYTDNTADTSLGIACDLTGNGVPPIFSMIRIWQGYAFMAGRNSSRLWFSKSNYPNAVDINDYRDLDASDGDTITGIKRFQSLLVLFKQNSIWHGSGTDRNSFVFYRYVSDVGAINHQCIVSVPVKNALCFIDANAKFYFYSGSGAPIPTAIGLEPYLSGLNQTKLSQIVGTVHKAKNQCRWIVPNGSSTNNDLMIWYDYLQDKWGTRDLSNVNANYIAELKDASGRAQCYIGGYSGYVWQADSGGSDDGTAVTCEVIDRGHPMLDPNPENQKSFYQFFLWFDPVADSTISVYGSIDDPDGTFNLIGTIDGSKASGQSYFKFNKVGRRLYLKLVESSSREGLVYRGWRVYYKDIGRQNAP